MSSEMPIDAFPEFYTMLSRHERGYDVMDTFIFEGNLGEGPVAAGVEDGLVVIESMIGYDLVPFFLARGGIRKIANHLAPEVYFGKTILQ